MAQKFYGFDRGEGYEDITIGSSSTATLDLEVRVDNASNMNRDEIVQGLRRIEAAILKDTAYPGQ